LDEWHEEGPEIYYEDGYHPECGGGERLWPRYTYSPVGRLGSIGADRDAHRCIHANIDTDADCNLYSHAYRNGDTYCHAKADSDVNLYGHADSDADTYRYFNCYPSTNGDSCPAYRHADASLSVPI
jgi:hypothetical protein